MLTPCTTSRSSLRRTRSTSPCRPRSRPVVTTTRSPFLIRNFLTLTARPLSQHLRRQRDDLHEPLGAQLPGHRAEDPGADRLALGIDQHRGVAVEADGAAVRPVNLLGGAHDHRAMHVALLDPAARDRLLDRDHDHVTDRRTAPARATEHADALHPARPGVVGDFQTRFDLDHGPCSRKRARLLRGLDQDLPALALGDRPALADPHLVADLEPVVLVVGGVLLRPRDVFLIQRMHEPPLDPDDHGLVALVADYGALHDAPRHGELLRPRAPPARREWS